jgi:Cu/Zn superoxide dismutase
MKHTFAVRMLSVIALVTGLGVTVSTSAMATPLPQYGIGFTKGCVSPTLVGAPYQCGYTIQNTIDTAGDTLTISNMSDIVHAAAGDVASPANYFALLHFDVLAGSPVCIGGTGTGTVADPWIGVTSCSMPAGSKLETDTLSYYTVAAGDFAVSPLKDEAILNWVNVCDGTGGTSCSTLPQHATTTSQSAINKNPSNTVTAIKQGGQTVTSVLAGSSVTDQATVSGSAGTPTGTVTFTFYTSGNCTTGGTAGAPVTLSGAVATSVAQGPLGQGSYSFNATYNGDTVYATSTGTCEPLTVGLNPSNTVTAIKQGGQTVTSVLAGSSVTDQATVSGSAGTPTGTVTFTFYTSGNCTTCRRSRPRSRRDRSARAATRSTPPTTVTLSTPPRRGPVSRSR